MFVFSISKLLLLMDFFSCMHEIIDKKKHKKLELLSYSHCCHCSSVVCLCMVTMVGVVLCAGVCL